MREISNGPIFAKWFIFTIYMTLHYGNEYRPSVCLWMPGMINYVYYLICSLIVSFSIFDKVTTVVKFLNSANFCMIFLFGNLYVKLYCRITLLETDDWLYTFVSIIWYERISDVLSSSMLKHVYTVKTFLKKHH